MIGNDYIAKNWFEEAKHFNSYTAVFISGIYVQYTHRDSYCMEFLHYSMPMQASLPLGEQAGNVGE